MTCLSALFPGPVFAIPRKAHALRVGKNFPLYGPLLPDAQPRSLSARGMKSMGQYASGLGRATLPSFGMQESTASAH